MSDMPKRLLDPSNLGELYPVPKTYDEIQVERIRVRHLRRSWLPRYPRLIIFFIILGLTAGMWLIAVSVPPMISFSLMVGVLGAFLACLLWVYCLMISIGKIRTLLDQVSIVDTRSSTGTSHDR